MTDKSPIKVIVQEAQSGLRLDQALAQLLPDISRSRLAAWIRAERIQVDGQAWRPRDRVLGGESIEIEPEVAAFEGCEPQDIPLDIVYQDQHILIINKPAGLVVHPAVGNRDGTLQNALLHLDPDIERVPRAGIVHRLDKDTTGLLVVARTLAAHKGLVSQLQERTMGREYDALVVGAIVSGGTIDEPVGRHPVDRKRMAVTSNGKSAKTHFRIKERFTAHTRVNVKLETGRTHQIRVHMAHRNYPLVGDPVYGGRLRLPKGGTPAVTEALRQFKRQALHAFRLSLTHPVTGQSMSWSVDLPQDYEQLLALLRENEKQGEADGTAW